jgi:hypothetical protein
MKAVDVPLINSTECENRLRQTVLKRTFVLDKESFLCAGGELKLKIFQNLQNCKIHKNFCLINIVGEVGKDACTGKFNIQKT